MAAKKIYSLIHLRYGWSLMEKRTRKLVIIFALKSEAIKNSKSFVKNIKGVLYIHKKNGIVKKKINYR